MTTPDHWPELDLADRLRLAALELERAGYPDRFADAIHEAADPPGRFDKPAPQPGTHFPPSQMAHCWVRGPRSIFFPSGPEF